MALPAKYWAFVGGYGTAIETFGFDPASGVLTPGALTEGVAEAPTFLALDEHVAQYRLDETTGTLSALEVPSVGMTGPAGPRHIAVHPTLRVVYALLDWSGEIACYRYDGQGLLGAQGAVSAFPPGEEPHPVTGTMTAAEIEVSHDGKRVFASTRTPTCQSLAVLDVGASGMLTLRSNERGAGLIRGPRHFISSRDGRHLLVANQDGDSLLVFRLEQGTGTPTLCGAAPTPTRINQPNALAWGRFA